MTRRRVTIALAAIFGLGLALRVLALWIEPPHHPDEFFQYLEPAWRHLTGAGVETWEWRAGIRSWALPGYHGAWMALAMKLGVRDGLAIGTFLRAHWALLSLTLVWAGWRGGLLLARRSLARKVLPTASTSSLGSDVPPMGWQGGLLAALLCAIFPLLVRFSIHTLSELPSILCMVWALVLTGELVEDPGPSPRKKAMWTGFLIGLGVCLRIQHAPVALVIAIWLLVARRARLLPYVVLLSLLPVALFGGIDWATWGTPFSSFIAYVKFNVLQSGADIFGKLPPSWYATTFFHRLPVGLGVLGLLCILGLRSGWPFVASALGLAALLSTQAHKEERFAMLCWPLLLIPAAGLVGAWWATQKARADAAEPGKRPRLRIWIARAATALFVVVVLGDAALHARGNDFADLSPDRFRAQIWAGRQSDITGLLYDEPLFTGGYMWFSRPFPQVMWKPTLLHNPLFSHVLAPRHSGLSLAAERAGFVEVFSAGNFAILRRRAVATP